MIIEVKYFHVKTKQDAETYDKLWDENQKRFVYLQTNLSKKQQINSIINNLNDNIDILVIRFPTINEIKRNKIINDILLGKGVKYECDKDECDKVWYPKEMWIYNPAE